MQLKRLIKNLSEVMFEDNLTPVIYLKQLQQNILSNLNTYNIIATPGNDVLQKRTRAIEEAIQPVGAVLTATTERKKEDHSLKRT